MSLVYFCWQFVYFCLQVVLLLASCLLLLTICLLSSFFQQDTLRKPHLWSFRLDLFSCCLQFVHVQLSKKALLTNHNKFIKDCKQTSSQKQSQVSSKVCYKVSRFISRHMLYFLHPMWAQGKGNHHLWLVESRKNDL